VQTNTEHEEDHPQFRQLGDRFRIPDEARREWTDNDACQQVPDDRGQADAAGDDPADECHHQCHDDINEQCYFVHSSSEPVSYLLLGY
jgi:hypothetical protein